MSFFKNIALALSGGGYRAATYHLGVLTCLQKVELLNKVSMISSVSGGSITAMKYAASLAEKKDFNNFSAKLEGFLINSDLIAEAAELIGTETENRTLSQHTLITAFAELYHRNLFSDKSKHFGLLWRKPFNDSHLKEVCFNSTEFFSGNSFRFIRSQSSRTRIGNRNLPLNQTDAKQARLGDILAASSCFPGGFEPIDLVNDFVWEKDIDLSSYFNKWKTDSIPLMDGGIYDNQGLEGIKLAIDRKNQFDTVIICDTDQEESYPLYQSPKSFKLPKISVRWSIIFISVFILLVVACIAYSLISLSMRAFPPLESTLIVLFLASISLTIFLNKLFEVVNGIKQRIPSQFNPAVKKLSSFSIKALGNALLIRGVSLVKMASTIFMKRVRGQVYESVFVKEELKDKIVSNLIYEIKEKDSIDGIKVTPLMLEKAKIAREMPTTLWFTDEDSTQFKSLKDTGEFTTAFKLINYIDKILERSMSKEETNEIEKVRKKLFDIWKDHCEL